MNKEMLIRVAAFCSKVLPLKPDFAIYEAHPSDLPWTIVVDVHTTTIGVVDGSVPIRESVPYDIVQLNFILYEGKFLWVGYSERFNTFVVQEPLSTPEGD